MLSTLKFARLTVVFLFISIIPSSAFAYIDPASGSIILQGLLAAIAGVAVTAKLYWTRIKSFFSRKTDANSVQSGDPKDDS